MSGERFARMVQLVGQRGLEALQSSHVALFGVGGVGSYTAEALVRSGIGELTLIDPDVVAATDFNRQLPALESTLGEPKVKILAERLRQINPDAVIHTHEFFYLPESADSLDLSCFSYLVDAVDTVAAKVELAVRAHKLGIPLVSCMGAGNKLDPTRFEVADIYATSVCPLCKVVRRELRQRGVKGLDVVYSREVAQTQPAGAPPGSISFVPPVAGMILAGVVVRSLAAL